MVHGLVELSFGVVDAKLGEQRVHTEGTGFVGDDGDDPLTEGLVLHQGPEHPNEGHGGGDFHAPLGPVVKFGVSTGVGHVNGFAGYRSLRDRPTECLTACLGVVGQRRHVLWQHVGVVLKLLVGEREAQVRAHVLHRFHVRLFLLVRRVTTGKSGTQTVAFDGA